MKKTLICISLLIILFNCGGTPKILFDESKHDFGNIEPLSKVNYIFTFHNTGNSILIIEKVKAG